MSRDNPSCTPPTLGQPTGFALLCVSKGGSPIARVSIFVLAAAVTVFDSSDINPNSPKRYSGRTATMTASSRAI